MTDPEGVRALAGWEAYERGIYGDHPELYAVEPAEFEPPDGSFFVVLDDGVTVAGGGFRRHSPDTCEIKRMWTDPEHRRKGHASAVLDAIEDEARRLGYSRICLETGPAQHESLAMYRRRYTEIAAYGYEDAIAFGHSF